MKKLILIILVFSLNTLQAQISIIPQPMQMGVSETFCNYESQNVIIYGNTMQAKKIANYFANFIPHNKNGAKTSAAKKSKIQFLETKFSYSNPDAYIMEIKDNSIIIKGPERGLFNGAQSLRQIFEQSQTFKTEAGNTIWKIPNLNISDMALFPYRGMHLDVCRHFFTVAEVKKYIDYLARYKFNTFHWHLTEDQGWRIEIKKYPLLTKVGAYRDSTIIGKYPGKGYDGKRHGGFYTQAQIKEVVAYAAKNYIEVIPEIEMPGHSSAALAAYPKLGCTGGPYKVPGIWGVFDEVYCAGNENTFQFMQDVLDEVCTLFPGKYIHIGGDECPKESWKKCTKCQARIKSNNLKDEHELQSYFIQRIEKYLNGKGKSIIGWDEILEGGLAPNATVMSWRGEDGGIAACKEGHAAIMTPGSHCYFDHSQTKPEDSLTIGGFTDLQKVFNYNPIPEKLRNNNIAPQILGAQGNVWTEYMDNFSKVEYQIFPRMLALSEVLWTDYNNAYTEKNFPVFVEKVKTEFKYLDKNKISHLPENKLPTSIESANIIKN
jgi:hexosaminidase